jgi:hypothetical protein
MKRSTSRPSTRFAALRTSAPFKTFKNRPKARGGRIKAFKPSRSKATSTGLVGMGLEGLQTNRTIDGNEVKSWLCC